ncbi:hypothetical protein [Nostoc sp. DSM 114167]|jgi:hypothetical protein|uniref:hypothetical protein n=1 Tax=Nostoc sp. DSM 114167 TaxID=3439050 RepID=UPI0040462CB7
MSEDEKEFDAEKLQKLWDLINPEVAPQHQQKNYKTGWNHERAEEARQRIKTTKPWLYSTGAITNLGKKIVSRNAFKHGLYSKVFNASNLESVEVSVTSADIERKEAINDTVKPENEDTLQSL